MAPCEDDFEMEVPGGAWKKRMPETSHNELSYEFTMAQFGNQCNKPWFIELDTWLEVLQIHSFLCLLAVDYYTTSLRLAWTWSYCLTVVYERGLSLVDWMGPEVLLISRKDNLVAGIQLRWGSTPSKAGRSHSSVVNCRSLVQSLASWVRVGETPAWNPKEPLPDYSVLV